MTVDAPQEDSRSRVVFLIPSLEAGGAERQLIGLARGLQRDGWLVRVLTFYPGGSLAGDLRDSGVVIETLAKRGRLDLPGFFLRLFRSLRRERPDIVHSYLVAPNIATVIVKPFLRGTRVVWGVRASDMNLQRYGRLPSLVFAVSCRLSRFADLIICNSAAGLAFHVSRGYPRSKMVTIPNGIDAVAFAPDQVARRSIRAEWGLADDEVLVGLVGRLDPMKDHRTFLRAARLVADDRPDVRFACVGGGPPEVRRDLERAAVDLGLADRVLWLGGRGDLPAVYNALDLLVSSSAWGEGFPNVVAEAMGSGLACVVTDIGDSALIVGDTGWVCRPGDAIALAAAITFAVSEPGELRSRGALARQRVLAEFTEARRDRSTAALLDRLVRRSRARGA